MKITGAIFDMDGTLVDSLGFWDILWKELGERFLGDGSFRPDPITEKAVRTVTLIDGMTLVHKNCHIGNSADEVFAIAEEGLKNHYRYTVEMKPGAIEFLDHLASRGVKMCIASATAPDLIDIMMEKLGLRKYFPKLFSCNVVGKGKEHPDIFIAAHAYLGTPKDSTWIFEDSLTALKTATAADYKTVGVYDKFNFGSEQTKEFSTVYVGEGDSLASLIKEI